MRVVDRDSTFDFAKGFGMLLVMFAHINYTEPIHTIIYSFHMPLFFIISGMLFDASKHFSFKPFLFRRIKSILLPYIIFSIISLVVTVIIQGLTFPNDFSIANIIKEILKIVLDRTYKDLSVINNPALWFLPCLFVIEILYFWINKIKQKLVFFS